MVKLGAWEDSQFVGVVVFSRGASANLLKPYGLKQNQGCELTRIAMRQHASPVSRVFRFALKMLRKANPDLQVVVSFADPHQGHHGGIYQAMNFIYTGTTPKAYEYHINGKKLHNRQVSEKGWNKQFGKIVRCPKPSECTRVAVGGKHRYVYPLTKSVREKVEKLAKPYPKK